MQSGSFTPTRLFLLLALCLVTFLHFSTSHPTSGSGGYTGAPGDSVCLNCHNTGSINGNVSLTGIPASVDPGVTYPITVTITNTVGTAARAGFQMVTLKNSTNTNAGTYSVPAGEDNVDIRPVGSGSNPKVYAGHLPAKTFATNTITYDVLWTAPTDQDGEEITFYAAALLANGFGTSGDRFTTTNVVSTIGGGGMTDPLTVTVSDIQGISCNGLTDGSATATAAGGTPMYNYEWDNGETTATATALSPGPHTVSVTDADNTTVSESVIIPDATALQGSITILADNTCAGGSDGSLSVTASGGTGTLDFLWSTGSTAQQIDNLSAGTYTVLITDDNGCTLELLETINEGINLVVNLVDTTDPTCSDSSDGSISMEAVGGTPPFTYQWNTTLGFSFEGLLSEIPAGTYEVTVTDANGCSATQTATLASPSPLLVDISNVTNETCAGANDGTAQVSVTGGTGSYSYNWSTGDNTQAIFGLSPGIYSVTVNDEQGCGTEAEVEILVGTTVFANINVDQQPSCGDENGILTASSTGGTDPVQYLWNNGENSQTIDMLAGGIYSVTATDANGCIGTSTLDLTVASDLDVSIDFSPEVSCAGFADGFIDVEILAGTGPFSIVWTDGSVEANRTGLPADTYSLMVSDGNGCVTSFSITIGEPEALDLTNLIATGSGCTGDPMGSILVEVAGGSTPYQYAWSNGDSTSTISNLSAGSYTATITDANGCILVIESNVLEGNDLAAGIQSTNVSCFGLDDGTASISALGGQPPYTVLWSDDATDLARSGLAPGSYMATVTDAGACTTVLSTTISEPEEILVAISTSDETSFESMDGSAEVMTSGGTGPLTILWSTGDSTEMISGLAPGDYSVTVTDSTSCAVSDTITVLPYVCDLAVETTATQISCPGNTDGSAAVIITGGTAPYTVAWSTADSTVMIDSLGAGSYQVSVVDSANCVVTTDVIIDEALTDSVIITAAKDTLCFGQSDGILSVSLGSGATDYSVIWSNGADTVALDSLAAGVYSATVTTSVGCTYVSEPYELVENMEIVEESSTVTDATSAGASDGGIEVVVSGGQEPYTYQWFDESSTVISTDAVLASVPAGEYYLCVTDRLGCTLLVGPLVVSESTSSVDLTSQGITVYPNPAGEQFVLDSDWAIDKVEIYSMQGRLLQMLSGGDQQVTVRTDDLAAGAYVIKVWTSVGIKTQTVVVGQ